MADPRMTNAGERHVAGAELRAIVAALPRVQRAALTLTKLQDLSLAEASRRSGISAGSLKVATFRAVRTIRERLAVEVPSASPA